MTQRGSMSVQRAERGIVDSTEKAHSVERRRFSLMSRRAFSDRQPSGPAMTIGGASRGKELRRRCEYVEALVGVIDPTASTYGGTIAGGVDVSVCGRGPGDATTIRSAGAYP